MLRFLFSTSILLTIFLCCAFFRVCTDSWPVAGFVDRYSPEARDKCVAAGGEPADAKKPKKAAAASPKKKAKN